MLPMADVSKSYFTGSLFKSSFFCLCLPCFPLLVPVYTPTVISSIGTSIGSRPTTGIGVNRPSGIGGTGGGTNLGGGGGNTGNRPGGTGGMPGTGGNFGGGSGNRPAGTGGMPGTGGNFGGGGGGNRPIGSGGGGGGVGGSGNFGGTNRPSGSGGGGRVGTFGFGADRFGQSRAFVQKKNHRDVKIFGRASNRRAFLSDSDDLIGTSSNKRSSSSRRRKGHSDVRRVVRVRVITPRSSSRRGHNRDHRKPKSSRIILLS
ncbi:uncharacterized protein LOC141856071 [Brevipalpus obovatus]|uniref:uncharacterized protein LOC141856071 n=1 Tax=Brevipalpus obovatus TaxID=246614 RepID=UPI003D9E199D